MADASNDRPQAENPSKKTRAGWLRKRARVLALFSIVALLGVGLLGGLATGHSKSSIEKMLDLKELALTDEQSDRIMGIMTETRKETIQLRSEFKVARIEMGDLLTQESVDKEAIALKADQIGQSAQQLVQLWTAAAIDVRDLLTPEQANKARPYLIKFLSHGHGGHGHKRWGRRGGHEER